MNSGDRIDVVVHSDGSVTVNWTLHSGKPVLLHVTTPTMEYAASCNNGKTQVLLHKQHEKQ